MSPLSWIEHGPVFHDPIVPFGNAESVEERLVQQFCCRWSQGIVPSEDEYSRIEHLLPEFLKLRLVMAYECRRRRELEAKQQEALVVKAAPQVKIIVTDDTPEAQLRRWFSSRFLPGIRALHLRPRLSLPGLASLLH